MFLSQFASMQPLTFSAAFPLLLSLVSRPTLAFPSIIGRSGDSKSLPFSRQVGAPSESSAPSEFLKKQFENPGGVLAVLLLIGGDIVQKAIAQLSSGDVSPTILTPAVFSFGWVGYAFGALMSAFGDGMLMPSPEIQSIVINVGSHIVKNNESFVLGRLLRDLEMKYGENTNPPKLVIRRFETLPGCAKPARDGIWMSFAPCLVLQFGFAAVPLHHKPRNWSTLVITLGGTLLAMATASLPQWRREKFDCGKNAKDTFIITRGNGHNNVFVIQPKKKQPQRSQIEGQSSEEYEEALNLEHLAVNRAMGRRWTRVLTVILAFLWIGLLIMVAGIGQDTWWLLAIGAVGMIQNVIAAGFTREPKAHGIPLDLNFIEIARQNLQHPNIMKTLEAAETVAPGVGLALVDVFFPGPRVLTEEERKYWDNQQKTLKERKIALQNQTQRQAGTPIAAQYETREAGSQTTPTLRPLTETDDILSNDSVQAESAARSERLSNLRQHGEIETGVHDRVSDNAFQAGPLAENVTLFGNTRH
jgi:hypothetical protein